MSAASFAYPELVAQYAVNLLSKRGEEVLLRFGVENHLSIRDRQELVLTAAKQIKRRGHVLPVPILQEDAVPVAVVYGANAAGKSNLVHAIRAMRDHIVMSHKSLDAGDPIPRHPFLLDQASVDKPSRFDCMFTIDDHSASASQEVYEYGFAFTKAEYVHEWLHRIVRHKRQTTQMLFDRKTKNGETQVDFGSRLRGENRAIASLTRPNSLFLSAAAQNNHPQLGAIHWQFAEHWQPLQGEPVQSQIAESFDGFAHQDAFMELMRQADLGVVGTELEDYEPTEADRERVRKFSRAVAELVGSSLESDEQFQQFKLFHFEHASGDGQRPLDFDLESRGTQRLAALAIPVLNAVAAGHLVVVDELDASLHHRLTGALVRLFKSAANCHGAQLVTTVHDTTLLRDELELDDVWFAEKDRAGVSRFTPLTDYRIRSREDLERVYRDGRIGGAPVIGDLAAAFNS